MSEKVEEVKPSVAGKRVVKKVTTHIIPLKLNLDECFVVLKILNPTTGNVKEKVVKRKIINYAKRVIAEELRKL
jgi:hypothetical protein